MTVSVFLFLCLNVGLLAVAAWEVADRGDPFLDLRFRKILTISCLQNETSPWTCPDHAECIPAMAPQLQLGSSVVTNLCICDEGYVNPDPYQYGENITVIYDEEDGDGDTIVISHDHHPGSSDSDSFEYEDDEVPSARCMARDDPTAKIEDGDPRWAILHIACNRELTGHPETVCPPHSECRNGKDCVCFDGWVGDPAKGHRECKGGATATRLNSLAAAGLIICLSNLISISLH